MEHEGEDGDPLELFGDNNLESDLRQLFSPSTSPNLSFTLPDASYSASTMHTACTPLDAGPRVKQEHAASVSDHGLAGAMRGDAGKGLGGEGRLGPHPVISERELREHFGIPLNEVAAKFGICITALKKLCRRYGVRKWPHRRLMSVEKRLQTLHEEMRSASAAAQGALKAEAAQLKAERERIYEGKGQDFMEGEAMDLGDDDVMEHASAASSLPPSSASARRVKEEGLGSKGKAASRGVSDQGGEPVGMLPLESKGASWVPMSGAASSAAPPGAFLPAEDPGIVAPDQHPMHDGHGAGPEMMSQLERLEEENSSLRAISKYLMQERKELARKAELSAKRNHNLYCLSRVLKLRLGVLHESDGGVDSDSLAVLDEVTADDAGAASTDVMPGGGHASLEFNADGLLSESHHDVGMGGGKHDMAEGMPGESKGSGSPFHQDLCWFAPGHGGEQGDDLLSDLI